MLLLEISLAKWPSVSSAFTSTSIVCLHDPLRPTTRIIRLARATKHAMAPRMKTILIAHLYRRCTYERQRPLARVVCKDKSNNGKELGD